MTDIVERLRAPRPDAHPSAGAADMAEIDNQRREAADEIERLRASLQAFVTFHSGHVLPPELVNAMVLAREALEEKPP